MMNFSRRSSEKELMDTEEISLEDFSACLRDLETVNKLTMAYRPTVSFLKHILALHASQGYPLEIVDVGSGYGDMLRQIGNWADRNHISLSLTGVDMNPWSRQAASMIPASHIINWITSDIFTYKPEKGIDIVISSLFTHHLSNEQIIQFLRWMEEHARLGWFISDLHRHPFPYYLFKNVIKLGNWHRFIRHDGPLSIARAFTKSDWQALIRQSGIDPSLVKISWHTPFRICVQRIKP